MKLGYYLFIFICFCSIGINAQSDKFNYHPPLKIPLSLSSNFGELRANHFHMGLDFKTNGKIGYNLYSIEDGFISRIKVSPYGYGKVIYIDHPNGVTSVYAHCSEFKGGIDSLVRETQKHEQNYEVEIFPAKKLPVKKGDVIALSGNTGSSSGPHLHFELRDTKTEIALNPLLYGFDTADTIAPIIRAVKLYAIDRDGYRYPNKALYTSVKRDSVGFYVDSNWIILPSEYCSAKGGIGFAAEVVDRINDSPSNFGLYGSYLIVNGDTLFGQQINSISFESTRFVSSHKDYEEFHLNNRKIHKSFKTSENDLSIYVVDGNGVIAAKPGQTIDITYVAYDVKNNKSILNFKLIINPGKQNSIEKTVKGQNIIYPYEAFSYDGDHSQIELREGCVFEPMALDISNIENQILSSKTPVYNNYRIKKKVENNDGKNYLEITIGNNQKKAILFTQEDDWLVADVKFFGSHQVKRDTIGPELRPANFTTSVGTRNQLTWKVTDSQSGLVDYDLFINGEWNLIEYEYKTNLLTFEISEELVGTNALKLIATDGCGNQTIWEKNLIFN